MRECLQNPHSKVNKSRDGMGFVNDLAAIPFGELFNVILTALMIPSA